MPTFDGVDHLALTVTDLDASETFYTGVLDFTCVLDFGTGRLCIHQPTGFTLALHRHPDGTRAPFSERQTGLDHLGLVAADRAELVDWERRLDAAGVTYTPIRDMELGHHLNFRDPDGIALEFYAPNEIMRAALDALRTSGLTRTEIRAFVEEHIGVPASGALR